MKWILLLLAVLALLGCESTDVRGEPPTVTDWNSDPRPLGKTLVYECLGGEFIARLGPGEMALWMEDHYVVLSQVRSASGVKYQEGDTLFWMKGEEAMLEMDGQHYTDCRLVPGRAPWEDARRRGVDFRAVGNEPGWYLEIQQGRQLLFVGDYGSTRLLLPDPGESREGDVRVYHAVDGDRELRVEIIDQPCTDTMKGDAFPGQVLVYLPDSLLQGCGTDLDHPWE